MRPRHRWLAILLAGGLVLVTASGAFTNMSAERRVTVDVVDSRSGYLGVDDVTPKTLSSGTHSGVVIIRLYNQFDRSLDSIGATSDTSRLTIDGIPTDLGIGTSGDITATVECGTNGEDITATIDIDAAGSAVSVSTSESVTINCDPPTVNFHGRSHGNTKEISFAKFCVSSSSDGRGKGNENGNDELACPSGETELLKFENDDGSFESEGDSSRGVSLTATEYKDGTEPIKADWESTRHDITTIVVKSGPDTCEFDAPGPPNENGTVTSCGLQ